MLSFAIKGGIMERKEHESYVDYIKRITMALEDKLITYDEWGYYILGADNTYSSQNLRKQFYFVSKMLNKIYNDYDGTSNIEIKKLENLKFEIIKERKKLQTVNVEYQENARKEGRFELFLENIENAIKELKPINILPSEKSRENTKEKTAVIFIGDAHYGRNIKMLGLNGEIIHSYNPKEFEFRMWNLLNQMEDDFSEMKIDKLEIADLGDNIENIMRMGDSIKNLKTGVVDSTVYYGEFMANWIIECHNRLKIPVRYTLNSGNHDILRILDSKPNFSEETVGKFIYNQIELRIKISKLESKLENKEINIELTPYSDVSYHNLYGVNMMCYHGDSKNMKTDIEFFENYYGVEIDILVGAHLHRNSQETIGIGFLGDKEIIRIPSICGTDTFSKKIRKNSRAGAHIITFTKDGKGWEKTYFLS